MVIGPTPPGHGGDQRSPLGRRGVLDVTDIAGVVTRVNDNGAGLDPPTTHELWPPDRSDHDICPGHLVGEIGGVRVAVGHCRVSAQQQHPHRQAQDRATTDHHHILAGEVDAVGVEEPHDAARSARRVPGSAQGHRREAGLRDPVHVLTRADRLEHGPLIDLLGHRVLCQDPVDARVVIQPAHRRDHLHARRGGRQPHRSRLQPDLGAAALLHRHVRRGCRVITNQDGRQARFTAHPLGQIRRACSGLNVQHLSDGRAVKKLCSHWTYSVKSRSAPRRTMRSDVTPRWCPTYASCRPHPTVRPRHPTPGIQPSGAARTSPSALPTRTPRRKPVRLAARSTASGRCRVRSGRW